MNRKILVLFGISACAFVFASSVYAMETKSGTDGAATASGVPAIDLEQYYKAPLKELNLTNVPLGNEISGSMFDAITSFIEKKGITDLILDNTGLKRIPLNLIGLGVIDKNLEYLSLKGNSFDQQQLAEVEGFLNQTASQSLILKLCRWIPGTASHTYIVEFDNGLCESEKNAGILHLFRNFPFSTVCMFIGILVVPQFAGVLVNTYPAVCHTGAVVAFMKACNMTLV